MDIAWSMADILNGLMALPNLISLLVLAPVIVQLTRDNLTKVLNSKE